MNDNSTVEIKVPRDRNSTFEPQIIPKHERRAPLFNDQIISMYSFGMSCRDIQRHLQNVYGVEVSPELISRVTESVIEDVHQWRNRPLEKSYPIVFLDALRVNSRQDGKNVNKALYVVLIRWLQSALILFVTTQEALPKMAGIKLSARIKKPLVFKTIGHLQKTRLDF